LYYYTSIDEVSQNDAFHGYWDMCIKVVEGLIYAERSMGVEKIFSRGAALADFSRRWPNAFFQGWAKSGEISFYLLETKRQTFFY